MSKRNPKGVAPQRMRKIRGGEMIGFNDDGTVTLPALDGKPTITINPKNGEDVKKLSPNQLRILMRLNVLLRMKQRRPDIQLRGDYHPDGSGFLATGAEKTAYDKDMYFKNWDKEEAKGEAEAKAKFNVDNVREEALLPLNKIEHMEMLKLNISPTSKYQYNARSFGYNQVIRELLLEKTMHQWENDMANSFNQTVSEYGNDAEKLYDEAKAIPDEHVSPFDMYNLNWLNFFNKLHIDDKYFWNPKIWGHNLALRELYKAIPRPKKKDWTDYFVEGLTMPFKIASQIPGLNMIPGIKQVANISEALGV